MKALARTFWWWKWRLCLSGWTIVMSPMSWVQWKVGRLSDLVAVVVNNVEWSCWCISPLLKRSSIEIIHRIEMHSKWSFGPFRWRCTSTDSSDLTDLDWVDNEVIICSLYLDRGHDRPTRPGLLRYHNSCSIFEYSEPLYLSSGRYSKPFGPVFTISRLTRYFTSLACGML